MKTLAVFFLVAACVTPMVAQATADQPFTVVIATEASEVKSGEEVLVIVKITNNSNQDLDMSGSVSALTGLNPNYVFDVRDDNGNPLALRVHKHPELAGGRAVDHIVKPGETLTEGQALSRLYDMSKPGKYVIQVRRRASEKPQDGFVKSNKITITVIPQAQ